MKILRPTAFQDSMLISSNAIEAYAAWSAGTTYAAAARVDYGSSYYQSIAGGNIGNQPDVSPTFWTRLGSDNKHAMFDEQVNTQTVQASPLTVVLATGVIDSIFFAGLEAVSIQVVVRDGLAGPIVYDQTQYLDGSIIFDWYQYFFFDPTFLRRQALFIGIPPFASSHVTVTVLNGSGDSKVGVMVFGATAQLGTTEFGASSGIIDYSVKETDDFGNTTFLRRPFSKRMTARVWVDNANLNRTQRILYDVRSTPSVWIGTDDPIAEEALVMYGFYKDFSTDVAYAPTSFCSLEIEGLI